MKRDVIHLSIPDFPIALARVEDLSLRGRPVAVAPGNSERALLQCVSAEARAEGVREGMPLYRARRFCPALTLLPPEPELIARGSRSLLEISRRLTPLWEPAAPGRLFLDLTGGRRLFGPGRDVAAHLERELEQRLRLFANVGVASNKLVSCIAASYLQKPGVCDVLRGSEKSFIAPLPVTVLPGVGRAREATLLHDLNLRRVEEITVLSVAQLRLAFGPFAPLLHQRALGIDPSPVRPPQHSTDVVEISFLDHEENDDNRLQVELCRLSEECGMRLRRRGKGAHGMTLTVTYADGVAARATTTFAFPRNLDLLLYQAAEELFRRAGRRRVRVKALQLVCGRLTTEKRQLDLFSADGGPAPRQDALQGALDALRERHGMAAVRWGRSLGS